MKVEYASASEMDEVIDMEKYLFGTCDLHGTYVVTKVPLSKKREVIVGWVNFRTTRNTVYIDGLGVLPKYRNRGYGKNLLQFAMKLRPTCKLMVDTTNDRALKLYTNNGFRIINKVPGYYDLGKHAYEMEAT
jgi:ribosomal protein S18 acetylase RimI-like enzyme